MKTLVVYYSLEGNTRFIAETIAQALKADILELKPKKDVKAKGLSKYFWGGRQVVMGHKPELEPFSRNPLDYELLIIGTPVWAFTYAPALRSFFSQVDLQGKKVAIFCTHEGGMAKTMENLKKALSGSEIVGETDFLYPLRDKESAARKAVEWVKGFTSL